MRNDRKRAGVCAYIRTDREFDFPNYLQHDRLEMLWVVLRGVYDGITLGGINY